MAVVYVVVTVFAIAANGLIALAGLFRARFVLENSAAVGVPESWLSALGLLKGAGVAGLLFGLLGVPLIGEAAALGLALFFAGTVPVHLRARNCRPGFPLGYLALAVASLVLAAAS